MDKIGKTTIRLGIMLTLVILTSSVYLVFENLNDNVRIDIGKTYSTFKVLENDKWVVSGVEYVNLFDGTAKMRAKNRSFETLIGENNITKVTRIANYKDDIKTIEVYTFDASSSDIELFPVSHSIQVINADRPSRPFILQYEVQKLLYTGETKWNVPSPQSFGRKMVVEWESGNYYSRIYKYKDRDEGKLTVKYHIDSDDYNKNVRLFDPPGDITITLNSPIDNYWNPTSSVTFNCSASIVGDASLKNISLWTNSTGNWLLNDTKGISETYEHIYDEFNDSSVNTTLWHDTSYTAGGATSSVTEDTQRMRLYAYDGGSDTATAWRRETTLLMSEVNSIDLVEMNITQTISATSPGAGQARTNFQVFGSTIDDTYGNGVFSTTDISVWKLTRVNNISCGVDCFNVTDDDVFVKQINATSNNISFYVWVYNGGSFVYPTANLYVYYVYYYSPSSREFTKTLNDSTLWTCQACDDADDCNFASENRTVFLDEQEPLINIIYPTVTNYTINISDFIYSASDENEDKCWYSKDNGTTNSSVVSFGTNFTSVVSSEGSNTWTVYCNDTGSRENSSSVTFFKDSIYPQIEYSANSDTSNSSGNFTTKDWIWINVSVNESNVGNVTFWTWTSTNNSFNKTTVTNNASIYILNQTGLSKDIYFWNVTVCDVVGQCNTTETRYYGDEVVNLSIDGLFANQDIELGGDLNISATSTFDYIFIDVDHPSYGINYSSSKWSTTFELLIDWFRKILFAEGISYSELNYNSIIDYNESSFNVTSHQHDEVVNISVNITGTNNPYDIGFFKCNTSTNDTSNYDRFFYGNLTSQGYIYQDKLVDRGVTPSNYTTQQNISFENEGELFLYFYMDSGAKLINFLLNVTSTEAGSSYSDSFSNWSNIDTVLTDAQLDKSGAIMPKNSSLTEFSFDDFEDSSVDTDKWDKTDDYSASGSGWSYSGTVSELNGYLRLYNDIYNVAEGLTGDWNLNFGSNSSFFTLQDSDSINFNLSNTYSSSGDPISPSYLNLCAGNTYLYLAGTTIWTNYYEVDEDINGEVQSASANLAFNLTKYNSTHWRVQISGIETSTRYDSSGAGNCGDVSGTYNWTKGIWNVSKANCANTGGTLDNDFYAVVDYDHITSILFRNNVINYNILCVNNDMDTKIYWVNNSLWSRENSTAISHSIFDSSSDMTKATMSSTGAIGTGENVTFYMSADDGNNWENIIDGSEHAFTNPGKHLKWKIEMNMTSPGYKNVTTRITDIDIDIPGGNISNVYFDVGADGTYEYSIDGDFTADNGTVVVDLSNASLSNAFGVSPAVAQTHYVKVAVNSSSAGQLNIEVINLTYNPNPIYLNITPIQTFLTNLGSVITNFSIDVASFGLNAIINLTDLKFDYAGGNSTYTVTAHNNDSSVSIDRNVTFYYSYWDYSWVPENVDYIFFNPLSPTTKNLKAYGQTDSTPILNITNYGYGLYDYLRDSIAHYIFNDNNQTLVNDSIGSNDGTWNGYTFNNGEVTGATLNETGKFGNAYDFDGNDDYVDLDNYINLAGEFSIGMWVYANEYDSNYRFFFGTNISGSSAKIGKANNSTKFFIRVLNGGSSDTSQNLPSDNNWHHIIVSRDINNKVDLIIDGGSANRLYSDVAQVGSSVWKRIGRADAGQEWSGSIDEVRIWNRALNQTEIQEEMNNANPVNGNGLVSSWSFEQNNATHTFDTNNLVAGKVGQAARFDGVGNYVTISENDSILIPNNGGTISLWINPNTIKKSGLVANRGSSGTTGSFVLRIEGISGIIRFIRWTGISFNYNSWQTSTHQVQSNQWQYVVIVYNGTDTDIYLDNIKESPSKVGSSGGTALGDFNIGFDTGVVNSEFGGSIDDVRIYNIALTEEEIGYIYNSGVGNESDDYVDYKNATLSVYLNDTLSCVNLTLSLDNNKSNGYVLNSSWQDLANMSFLDTEEVYLFADYDCSYFDWRLFNPYISFRNCCENCICSEVVI